MFFNQSHDKFRTEESEFIYQQTNLNKIEFNIARRCGPLRKLTFVVCFAQIALLCLDDTLLIIKLYVGFPGTFHGFM